jgi:hypothetical protein
MDSAGSGGHIHIDDTVTHIGASLFAEGAITSSGTLPLSLSGSVISANTTGGATTSPKICPYFVTSCTETLARRYDLELLRPQTTIEYDGRVIADPPPGTHESNNQ